MEAHPQIPPHTTAPLIRQWLWVGIILSAGALVSLVTWQLLWAQPKGWSQMIPGDALVILRINQPSENWFRWKKNPALTPILTSELIAQVDEPFMAAKLALKKAGLLKTADTQLKLILSLHPAGEESRALVLIPQAKEVLLPYHKKVLQILIKEGWNTQIRTFRGEAMIELKHPRLGRFAMALLDEGWIGSRYPELIEDCIRRAQNDFPALPIIDEAEGKASQNTPWLALTPKGIAFLGSNLGLPTAYTNWVQSNCQIIAGQITLPQTQNASSWSLTGRWIATDSSDIQAATLPEGTPFDWMAHIPTQTAIAQIWRLDRASQDLQPPLSAKDQPTQESWVALSKSLHPQWIALQMEPFAQGENIQALLIQARDSSRTAQILQTLDPYLSHEKGASSVYTLSDARMSAWLTAPAFDLGPGTLYAALAKGYLLISKDRSCLSQVRQAIYEKDTWASLQQKPQLNPKSAWHILARPDYCHLLSLPTKDSSSQASWQKIAKSHDWLYLSGNSLEIQCQLQVKATTQAWKPIHWIQTDSLLHFDQRPAAAPFIQNNPSTQKQELWALTSSQKLTQANLTNGTRVDWQLPFLPDDKPHVWQSSSGATYLTYWNGRKIHIVTPADTAYRKQWLFPGQTGKITYAMALAAPASKDRPSSLLLIGKSDTMPMYLDPNTGIWSSCFPIPIKEMMPEAPSLLSINGETIGLFATHTGAIWALNLTQRQVLPGFPIQMPDNVLCPIIAQAGINYEQSQFQVLTRLGEILSFTLEGTKISRYQILRPDKNTRFAPIPEANGRGAWIARLALGKLDLFDNKGQATGLSFPVNGEIPFIQLYRFGGSHAILSLTYRKTGRCYLYDQDGRKLTDTPLEAISPIQVLYSPAKNRLTVFTASPTGFQKRVAPLWN